ncbi:hypothetical protein [Streptomyces albipurpureus]|uniref:Lipoprotein n=1 Tax=Streptomyces albipurpureus TaxID=2897419 RepID=A0ABT0UHQ0_9ACTN|nr:hypothetical protein [Streptomyces sp. CWNU-1]MCM2388174.1 hypothetical protein [Streptomyces sp. CWNU-1]
MRNHKLAVAVASGIAGLVLFVSGCSSSSGGEESSSSGESAAPGGGSGGDDSAANAVDKDQKLRKCLRDKGVKIADLPPGTDPRTQTLFPPEGTPPEKWQKALEACGTSPQGGSGDGASDQQQSDQQQSDQQLKIIQCLRGKGFTMPDPKPAKGGMTEAFRVPQGADPDKFMTALNECAA